MRPDGPRDDYAGPESGPEPPFPIKLQGPVIKGFGRGSKELGIPTANIPSEGLSNYPDLSTGIYFGYTSLLHPPSNTTSAPPSDAVSSPSNELVESELVEFYPSVLSIGYNPFYNNKTRSIEIHVLHKFPEDFYGSSLKLLVLGFIRPEYDYVSKDSLIEDIMTDCKVAERSLKREKYRAGSGSGWESWLRDFRWAESMTGQKVKEMEKRVLGEDKGSGTAREDGNL